jgi:hypothetical protein
MYQDHALDGRYGFTEDEICIDARPDPARNMLCSDGVRFAKGLLIAPAISTPIWILIITVII